jgi:tetratricopeptide (TPR) repeat protein
MNCLQNILLILLTFGLSSATLMAAGGSNDENKLYSKGRKALIQRDFQSAATLFTSLTELDATNAEYQFLAGLSYYAGPIDREKSIPYLESSVKNFSTDTIAEAYYYLAKAYSLNGQFDEAIAAYEQFEGFIVAGNKDGTELQADVKRAKENAVFARNAVNDPSVDFEVKNMGAGVNTAYPDYAPVVTPDGERLLFTSRRDGTTGGKKAFHEFYNEDIYMASNDGESWTVGNANSSQYLFDNFNTSKQDAGVVYTQNGQRLYIYRSDKIYESIFEGSDWSQPEKMAKIDSEAKHVPSVTLTEDGKTMYFVNNRKDAQGGRDLYKTIMDGEGEWSEPTNLGAGINTSGDEDAPFISGDGKTLYFASNGHVGMGGYDLFKLELLDDGTWGDPVNMGYPLNSPADDIYYVESKDGETAYFASSRIGTTGAMDLYEVSLNLPAIDIQLAGIAFDPDARAPLAVTITFTDTESGEVVGTFQPAAKTGTYSITVPSEKIYEVQVAQDGGNTYTKTFEVPKQTRPYTSFQTLEIRDLNDEEGKTYAHELTVRTGLFDVKDLAEPVAGDLDQTPMTEQLDFLKDGNINVGENILFASYLSEGADRSDPRFSEWTEKKDFESLVNLDPSTLGDRGIFKKEFTYNEKAISTGNASFIAWIDLIADIASANDGEVTLHIEASASRVPTRTFRSNKRLSKIRSDGAKAIVIGALAAKGVDVSKIKWEEKHLVQGPAYAGDFENFVNYEAWQYVMVKAK